MPSGYTKGLHWSPWNQDDLKEETEMKLQSTAATRTCWYHLETNRSFSTKRDLCYNQNWMLCIYSWFIWLYISHPRWHGRSSKSYVWWWSSFWTSVLSWVKGDWWKTIVTVVIIVLIILLCGPCFLQCLVNFVTQRLIAFSLMWVAGGLGYNTSQWMMLVTETRSIKRGEWRGNSQGLDFILGLFMLIMLGHLSNGLWILCLVPMETT